ncbi:complex I subunit 5 family protein [Natranaerobius thermophilus]|uniref:NADH dehydrogenase (Quinone) n=1 Tax=Natranaerobius thermophilus (strain ATCC BAA-1301 / DSM 18059 / JW/NM-WN-LF) TaxID=457570 RepID=B2A3T0_NATTJ|nr:monovalent cation/H+ antiporter subunit D family protein [Natranaerobius thermophilus]ACB83706.1 NADH dehydrogenase (quinone) [Natranaerobius thermophilus JW/NM-WN-LF]
MSFTDLVYSLPMLIVLFPLIMTGVIFLVEQKSIFGRNLLSVVTSAITFLMVAAMYPVVIKGEVIYYQLANLIPPFGISFMVDTLGFGLSLLASFIWMLVTIYSLEYMKKENYTGRYYPALSLTLSGSMGLFLAGDLFTMFIFFEIMSLVSYLLIIHNETKEALRAGYKYLIVTIIGGLFLFFGIIITFELSQTITLSEMGIISTPTSLAFAGFLSFVIGFGMKAGMVPLHIWLPEAHPVAPSPASALLSGIMIKTGAYGLIRIMFHVFDYQMILEANWHLILAVVAVITIFLGSAVAITQEDLKRRLAYSSIGQMGYILLGLAILTETAMTGDIFHIFSHAFMKSTLFLAAGAMIMKTGKKKIADLKGVGRAMPLTMLSFTIAALAMIGIPPLNGFISKWSLSLGALEAGQPYYVVILLISSLMNSVYYLPIINTAYFGKSEETDDDVESKGVISEAPMKMVMPVAILGFSCLILSLFPTNIPYELAQLAAKALINGNPF